MTKVNENSGIRNMRSVTLRRLYFKTAENVAHSEVALMNLKENFEDGRIPACKARKEAARLISVFEIDVVRYNNICLTLMSEGTLTIGHTLISTIPVSVTYGYRIYFA